MGSILWNIDLSRRMEAMTKKSDPSKHVLSVDDLSDSVVSDIFARAAEFKEKGFSSSSIYSRSPGNEPVVALAFFEPSTRTKLSFDTAAQRIGAKTIGFDNPESTSSAKGEQLSDTLRVIEKYADAIVVRRKAHDTVDIIREHVTVPVISAGVGSQEHPTQGLLDVFTIQERRSLDSISHVCSYGDLINSRTMFSQVRLMLRMAKPGITFSFVADKTMQISQDFKDELEAKGATVVTTNKLGDVISDLDILHVIRPQKERWEGLELDVYSPVGDRELSKMKSDAILLHALPRTGELDPATDADPRSAIWDQVENGLYIRAALLERVLS